MPQYNFGAGRLYLIPNGADTRADQPVECGALQDIDVTFDGSAHVLTSARTWAVMASPGRRSIKAKAGAAQISPQFLAAALAGGSSPGARRVERGEPATITAGVVTAAMPGCIADLGVWDTASGRQFERVGAPAAALLYATDDAGVWTFAPADEGKAVTLDYLRAAVDGVRVEMNNVPMGYTPRFAVVLSGSHGSNRMTLELASCVLGSLALGAKLGDWLIPGLTFSAQARADGYVGRLSLDDPADAAPLTSVGPATSWTYPLYAVEEVAAAAALTGGSVLIFAVDHEAIDLAADLTAGTLVDVLRAMDAGLDAVDVAADMTGGTLVDIRRLLDVGVEALDVAAALPGGALVVALVMNTADPEGVNTGAALTGGTLL